MSFFRHENFRSQTKSVIQLIIIEINVGFLCPFLFSNLLCMPKGLFLSNHKMKQSNTMMMNRKRKSSQKSRKTALTCTGLIASPAALSFSLSSSSNRLSWLCSVVLLCGVFTTGGKASPFSLLPPGGQQQSPTKQMLKAQTTMQQQ